MQKKIVGILIAIFISVIPLPVYANITMPVPVHSTFKTFMDYRAISNHHSPQWVLETQAYTDENGLRKVGDRFLIAVGSYYTKQIGQALNVKLDNGTILKCIVGDAKADRDTINGHSTGTHNDVVEFIVDQRSLHPIAKDRGDCSFVPGLAGAVSEVTLVDTTEQSAVEDTLSVCEESLEALDTVVETNEEDIVTLDVVTEDSITANILEEFSEADVITEG